MTRLYMCQRADANLSPLLFTGFIPSELFHRIPQVIEATLQRNKWNMNIAFKARISAYGKGEATAPLDRLLAAADPWRMLASVVFVNSHRYYNRIQQDTTGPTRGFSSYMQQ